MKPTRNRWFDTLMIIALCAWCAAAAAAADQAQYTRVLSAITAPAVSTPLMNQGQTAHMLTVFAPGATADITSGLQIRIEGSHDGQAWYPITADLTALKHNGEAGAASFSYGMVRANAPWPYVRVKAVAVPGASQPITAWYTGSPQPLGTVKFEDGRYTVSAPGGSGASRLSWILCDAAPCTVLATAANPQIITTNGTVSKCYIAANVAPLGADLKLDLTRGGASVLPPAKFVLPAGSTAAVYDSLSIALTAGDLLNLAVLQVGTTQQGQGVSLACIFQ